MEGVIVVIVVVVGFVMIALAAIAVKQVRNEWRNKDEE